VDGLEKPAISVAQEAKVDAEARIPEEQQHNFIVRVIAFVRKFRLFAHPSFPNNDEVAPIPLGSARKYPAAIATIDPRCIVTSWYGDSGIRLIAAAHTPATSAAVMSRRLEGGIAGRSGLICEEWIMQ